VMLTSWGPIQGRFLAGSLALSGSFVAALALLGSYIPEYRAVALFWAGDGWCAGYEPVGAHCFGDYGLPMLKSSSSNPWSPGTDPVFPYHATLLLWFRLFLWISVALTPNAALGVYLVVLLLATSLPGLWALRRLGWIRGTVTFVATTLLAFPFLLVMDRGSSVGLAVPGLLICAIGFVEKRPWWVFAGVLVASSVRPQFLLLAVLLLLLGAKWRFILSIVGSALLFLTSFVAWSGSQWTSSLWDYVGQLVAFNDYQPLTDAFPSNYSAARLVVLVAQFISLILSAELGAAFVSIVTAVAGSIVLGGAITGVLLIALYRGRNRMPDVLVLALVFSTVMLVPSISFGYNTAFAMVLGSAILVYGTDKSPDGLVGQVWEARYQWLRGLLLSALALSLAAGVIPVPDALGRGNIYPSLVAAAWLALLFGSAAVFSRSVPPAHGDATSLSTRTWNPNPRPR
jgi:hypothetical protein